MKNERLLKVFGQIDEKYIEEATPFARKVSKKDFWAKWRGVVASHARWDTLVACTIIILFIGIYLLHRTSDSSAPDTTAENLPLLSAGFESDGMGFEGLMYYDISEADNKNPWTAEADLTTLPVYRNPAYSDGSGTPLYLSDEEMLSLAESTAAALDTTIEGTEYTRYNIEYGTSHTDNPADKAYSLTATTSLGNITISGNGEVKVSFDEPLPLPDEYSFTDSHTSDEKAVETLHYLTERFSELRKFNHPIMETGAGDYTFSGEQYRYYRAYEGNGSLEEQILHYHFDALSFSPDEEGNLWLIRFGNILDSAEKLGDYPLITVNAAQKHLLSGEYITSVPGEYLKNGKIKKEYIAKVELVYRTGNLNEVFMPYYRFYVELTEFDATNMAEGLKNYGIYYVPAVSEEYLSDFPTWDGNFN